MAAVAETREFRAEARFQRVSPQKARLVLNLIKGRSVGEALDTANFSTKSVAVLVKKVLTSALDNAKYLSGERGLDIDVDNLYVKNAIANEGPRMKRIRPAPMGRAFRYQRRLAHIIILIAERPGVDDGKKALVTKVEAPVTGTEKKSAAKKATAGKTSTKTAVKKTAPKKTAAK